MERRTRMRARLEALPWWARLLIAATGSFFMGIGAPPSGNVSALVWLGFIPIVLMLRVTPRERMRSAFFVGWVGGLCVGLVGFPWIAELIVRFAELPWVVGGLVLMAFSAWTALPFGLWGIGVVFGPQRGWLSFAWPIGWWIVLADLWPHMFPYTPMIGFAEVPAWMQAAELLGVPGVEAQVLAVGLFAAAAILDADLRKAGVAVAIPILSTVLGHWRLSTIDDEIAAARKVAVGIVQPNNALMDNRPAGRMKRLHSMSARAQAGGAQLVIWPEAGSFPYAIKRPFARDISHSHRRILLGYRLPTIFGAGTYSPDEAWERNSVFNMAADGTIAGRYDKVVLVPIGEYVPIIDPNWLRRQVPAVSHNIAGDGPVRFEIQPSPTPDRPDPGPPVHAGPLVCYEDIMPDFARDAANVPGGVELFVNVTIDTWFGDTAEPWEHLALAQFRSVEHRIPMVRSVAAGVSAYVDAGGRLAAHLPVTAPTIQQPVPPQHLVAEVALPRNTEQQPTFYARLGWLLPWLCHAWAVLVLGRGVLARVRRNSYKRPANAPAEPSESDDAGASDSEDP